MADAADSKSAEDNPSWGFDPPLRHQILFLTLVNISKLKNIAGFGPLFHA